MKKRDVGPVLAILANAGVIASIFFLAIQLRQNNELMDAERRFNRLEISTGSVTLLATTPSLAAAVAKSDDPTAAIDDLQLTPGDYTQVRAYYSRVIRNQEWTYSELPKSELPVQEWKSLARRRSWRVSWAAEKNARDEGFVEWMEGNILSH
jgi:hypothetical protein